ncbi:putative ABC transporter ATP-binding protein YheS [Candidatus Arcanobacter lacustris]|jgi:ATP-binding cassette subfamily F protein 3|uniref:Putative ABC transporter ATP-binding protein YheS n=1 Tax=Candidatus Arcanibacter lacustris TaxID=1607817 RepID=A0A0F5MP88_9RICK|nr:putative ABC transporter ATP-binding protein YheS [Candidatus Arcanobacter lacustris]
MLFLDNISYHVSGRTILEKAQLQLPDGHKAGLIGRNGAGKSTLFNIILNNLEADSGEVQTSKGMRIVTVSQEVPGGDETPVEYLLSSDPERNELFKALENCQDNNEMADIYDRLNDIDAFSAESRASIIIKGLGFTEEQQASSLSSFSGGFRMRVALAAALFRNPDLLLLDEPTNHLDFESIIWLKNYLKNFAGSLLVVSHDREFLNEVVQTIFHLQHGKITTYKGNYDAYENKYKQQLMTDLAFNKKIESQKQHMQKFVDRFAAKASKAKQAQSRMKAISKLSEVSIVANDPTIKLSFPMIESIASPVISYDKVSLGYDDKIILRNLSGSIVNDDRIALLGANGNGKSTFAKFLAKTLEPLAGQYNFLEKLKIGYFTQHQFECLNPENSSIEHIKEHFPTLNENQVRTHLGGFAFKQDKATMKIGLLSGGEKARLVFATITAMKPHILILDEPTNHLDIEMRESLIFAINEFEGAVIIITHDLHLLEHTVDKLWIVEKGNVTNFPGTIEDYIKSCS